MAPSPTERLRWSPHWRIELTETGDLILSAGADRRYALRGIGADLGTEALGWAIDGPPLQATPAEHRLIDRLVDAGALRPGGRATDTPGNARSGARLHPAGDEQVVDALIAAPALRDVDLGDHGDLGLLIRAGDDWPSPPAVAHLAVDCSLHHTVVLGPYVIPGHSACTACLDARVARRWEPVAAAPTPAMHRHLGLVAHLLAIQIELIGRGTSPLVNATIAWDLERGTTDAQTLLKMPGCGGCDTAHPTGKLPLAIAAVRQAVPA